jgi:hypothetical protein
MNKTVLAILLFAAFVTANAQTIVPRIGLTVSSINFEEEEDVDITSRVGFTIGAGFNIPVNDMFSIQPELNFIQKGVKSKYSDSYEFGGDSYEESFDANIGISYLEVPVLVRASFGTATKFFINAGPSLGIGLGGKTKIKYSYSETIDGQTDSESLTVTGKVKFGETPEDSDEGDAYINKRVDIGVQLGLGVLIMDKFIIEARYGLGLTDIEDDTTAKNRAFQLSFAMPFSLK